MGFNKPILFITFNRLDTTKKVFQEIKKIQPEKLYISSDGPRFDNQEDSPKILEIRRFLLNEVDWECQLQTLFHNQNKGCKLAVSEALNWFFKTEEYGIILEDDTLPNDDFFQFMDFALDKFRYDERIAMVTGSNPISDTLETKEPYFFSEQHFNIWGWATWRRCLKGYDIEMKEWDNPEIKKSILLKYRKKYISEYYRYKFNSLKKNYNNTWDIQWVFLCLRNERLCVTPSKNYISNIDPVGTHGKRKSSLFFKPLENSNCNYSSFSPVIKPNTRFDEILHFKYSLLFVLVNYVKEWLRL